MVKKQVAPPSARRIDWKKELVPGMLVAELLGTFILTFAALFVANNPVIVAVVLLILVLMFMRLTGGHINPAVTIGLAVNKQLSWGRAVGFIVAQLLGAMLAVLVATHFIKAPDTIFTLFNKASDPQVLQGGSLRTPGTWKPIWGELLGGIVFGLGVGAAVLGKREGYERAFLVGGSLMLGLFVALAGSYAVLNPAVALGLSGYAEGGIWSFLAYGIGPVVGVSVGSLIYRWLQTDVEKAKKN